jgi:sulfite exporter TauE/SafE
VLGTSLVMIAVGAILKFAVTWTVSGIDLRVVGVVLMVVGTIGLLLGIFLLSQNRRGSVGPRPPR